MFKELKKGSYEEVEKNFIDYWENIDILKKSIDTRDKKWVFYDGPAFANGFPGLHHMVSKNLKDAICKYKTMQGYSIIRKVGWDTHGLPIENHVEKKLGFNSKKEIEAFGIEKFNQECRKSVRENEDAFIDLTHKMGQFIDTKNPYLTYKNEYIETEWWILKKFFDERLFYEGKKVLPYCPRCGTGLASHEVAQGYKEVSVDTVIVTMKKKDEDCYFLVWTTTPWTLLANVALCVNPDEMYVKVLSQGYKFILAKALVNKVLGDDYEILEEYTGKELEYVEYEQLIPELKVSKKAFYVTCDTYVTMEDGTGVVHMAPAFGEDDANVCKKYDLPILNPVGLDGKYSEGPWQGTLVFDADLDVIKYLKANDKLFKKQKMVHEYPHCWRCDSPLLYYAMPSYYIAVSKFKDKLVKANEKVNWYPEYVGTKRFGNWLESAKDWAVSRTRYWGTPIPYWKCSCGHSEMIGSIKELKERSVEEINDSLDLHKPYIDNIHLKCPVCGKEMQRIPDVLDCWFDSGSMPFAQYHYPFENKELFEHQFPADFICEGIDQTRGWFYTLLVISTFVKGCSPYKNVLVNDLLLDSEGKKMSKSRGNIVEPFTTMKEYGADTVRFYLPYVSPVWTPLKFNIEGLKEVYSKFFNPFKNTYTFFETYANIDKVDPREFIVEYDDLEEIDKWLLSKYNRLLKDVTSYYEEYDLNKVVKVLTSFVSDDLSNWYIRRNRDRFWGNKLDNSKKSVYQTTYQVLIGLTQMLAPISPYISEEIYQNLTGNESVHLSNFPEYDESLISEEIEERMDLARDLISLGRYVREEVKIKIRQPLSEMILDGKKEYIIKDLVNDLKEELNIKKVVFITNLSEYMNFEVKPNFKVCGPILGNKIKEFSEALKELTNDDIEKLENNEKVKTDDYEITTDMVDIRISSKDGFDIKMENNNFVIINTALNDDLIKEGIAREIVSKVQNLRKQKDFDVADRINMFYNGSKRLEEVLKDYEDYIKKETLSINFIKKDDLTEEFQLNDITGYLDVEKYQK
ncbi:MAG TPA: isoleucine--tRNA ligase [Bacilli bacterium]|nr:isoleucine--tRNA ligase [Bacilli bacterium]